MFKKIIKGIIGFIQNKIDNPIIDNNIAFKILGKTKFGNEIKLYIFGNGDEKILYFGGMHGNEIGTVKLMNKWINFLSKNEGLIPKSKQIFIINCLNVDGYNLAVKNPDYFGGGSIGKPNSNNIDLNRNFPTSNWQSKAKMFILGKYIAISCGKYGGSEIETKTILNIAKSENIKTIYEFHNCRGNVMANFRPASDKKALEYVKKSGFKLFSKSDWDKLDNLHKTGSICLWGYENDIDIIEIENITRYSSERRKNKQALINSLYL
ncbi:MAG: M14 family zinc carboxypeptidase [Candidatus Gracilibacteria bacterium]|nr:M14 family zinc carboxypeptidase [Candidatus Gracilibacteria bacterium]